MLLLVLLCLHALSLHASADRVQTDGPKWCAPCDMRACAQVNPDTCSGQILRDHCGCCPMCVQDNEDPMTSLPARSKDEHAAKANFTFVHSLGDSGQTDNACSEITCPKKKVCMLNIQGIPFCRCPSEYLCKKGDRDPLCGEDDITYKSKCFLKMVECEQQQNIAVKHKGRCVKREKLVTRLDRRDEQDRRRKLKLERIEKRRTLLLQRQAKHDQKQRTRNDRKYIRGAQKQEWDDTAINVDRSRKNGGGGGGDERKTVIPGRDVPRPSRTDRLQPRPNRNNDHRENNKKAQRQDRLHRKPERVEEPEIPAAKRDPLGHKPDNRQRRKEQKRQERRERKEERKKRKHHLRRKKRGHSAFP